MADTISNVKLLGVQYQNLNTLTGIAVGTKLEIQNQTTEPVRLSISSTQPSLNTDKFFLLKDDISIIATISAGENNVWAFGNG